MFVSLCLQMYYHGESIAVNVQITNNSNKSVKRIKVAGTLMGSWSKSVSGEFPKLMIFFHFSHSGGWYLPLLYGQIPVHSRGNWERVSEMIVAEKWIFDIKFWSSTITTVIWLPMKIRFLSGKCWDHVENCLSCDVCLIYVDDLHMCVLIFQRRISCRAWIHVGESLLSHAFIGE